MSYNETCFTPEEVEKGMHLKLIDYLLSYNKDSEDNFNDIHITTDGYCTVVQWIDRNYEFDDGGRFEFVDAGQKVMTECELPDNSIVMCYDEEDAKDTLDNWLKNNPGYEKNEYGHWVNTNEKVTLEDLK